MKKVSKKKALAASLTGCLAIGGIMGASAFFTDKAQTSDAVNAGTMNMVFSDYSDLDGNYRNWTSPTASEKVLTATGLQAAKIEKNAAYDAAASSLKIINPGDSGLLQFSLKSDREKSFDVGIEVVVNSTVPLTDGADEYTVEGLGTPVKSADKKSLTYRANLGTFDGTVEKDGGQAADEEHIYAYNVDFSRLAGNSFVGANFTINVNAYAKQHRNSLGGDFKADVADADGHYNTKLIATGDWASIGGYEITLEGSDKTNGGTVNPDQPTDPKEKTVLMTGSEVNSKLATLAGGKGKVKEVKSTTQSAEDAGAADSVEIQSAGEKVVAYVDPVNDGTILLNTDADTVYLNADSSNMFDGYYALTAVDAMEDMNASDVQSMSQMFNSCSELTTLDVSNWQTEAITDVSGMFKWDDKLETIYSKAGAFDVSDATSSQMFYNCAVVTGGYGTSMETTNKGSDGTYAVIDSADAAGYLTDAENIKTSSDTTLIKGGGFLTKIRQAVNTICGYTYGERLYDSSQSLVTSVAKANSAPAASVKTVELSTADSKDEVTGWYDKSSKTFYWYTDADTVYLNEDASRMFAGMTALANIDSVAEFNSSKTENMAGIFIEDEALTSLSAVSGWDTSNVTNLGYAFRGAKTLSNIDALANWDVSKVTDMHQLFFAGVDGYPMAITSLKPLAKWNVSQVTDMSQMFSSCTSLKDVSDISGWKTASATNMREMFYYTTALKDASSLGGWNVSDSVDTHYAFRWSGFDCTYHGQLPSGEKIAQDNTASSNYPSWYTIEN